jgi:hypothetical protein
MKIHFGRKFFGQIIVPQFFDKFPPKQTAAVNLSENIG